MSAKEVNPKGGKLQLVTRLPTQERLEEQAKQLMHDFPESYARLTFQDVKIRLMKEYIQEMCLPHNYKCSLAVVQFQLSMLQCL